jgi:hypothetical protein
MALRMICRWLEMEEKDKPCKGLQFSIREVYEDIFRAAKKVRDERRQAIEILGRLVDRCMAIVLGRLRLT